MDNNTPANEPAKQTPDDGANAENEVTAKEWRSNFVKVAKRTKWPFIIVGPVLIGAVWGAYAFIGGAENKAPSSLAKVRAPDFSVLDAPLPLQRENIKRRDEERRREKQETGDTFLPMTLGTPEEQEQNSEPEPVTAESVTDKILGLRTGKGLSDKVKDPARPKLSEQAAANNEEEESGKKKVVISTDDLNYLNKIVANWEKQVKRKPNYKTITYTIERPEPIGASSPAGNADAGNNAQNAEQTQQGQVIVEAGQTAYASLRFRYDSDLKNVPLVSMIHTGPLNGAQLIGTVNPVLSDVVVNYNTLIFKGKRYSVEAYAVGSDCNCLAIGANFDPRIIETVLIPAAAKFVTGYGLAALAGRTTVTVDNGVVIESTDEGSKRDRILSGLSNVASDSFDGLSKILPTEGETSVDGGVPHGVFFVSEVRQ